MTDASEHKFKVGQAVGYHPPRGLYAPRGLYIVTAALPARYGELNIGSGTPAKTLNGSRWKATFAGSMIMRPSAPTVMADAPLARRLHRQAWPAFRPSRSGNRAPCKRQ